MRVEESAGDQLEKNIELISEWESWDSDIDKDDTEDTTDHDSDKEQDDFQDCHPQPAPAQIQQEVTEVETPGSPCDEDGEWRREEGRESRIYLYLNTIPILGALYGLGRFVYYQQLENSTQVTASLWGISKNVLNSLTLTAGALLVPLNIPDLIAASVATGILEGIVDTLLDYFQSSRKEREDMTVEEILYNVVNHAPIIGIIYDFGRLLFFLKRDKEEVKKSVWGLVANSVTTAITIASVIKFSLKATGSIPSGMARSAQAKVTFTLAKKGVTAPVVQAGKVLATKEVKKLRKRIKRELSELKTKMKEVETEKFLRGLGLGSDLHFEESDCRFLLRKRLKSFIDSKKSSKKNE